MRPLANRAVVFLFSAVLSICADPSWLGDFDSYALRGMRDSNVPGLAVGVIQDGKIIFAKGYGVRDLKDRRPVTTQTLFGVGSVTKSFTAAVVGSVIDDGKLAWDRPLREFVPWFRMYDPVATDLITIRDMLTHRSGLPRHDFIRFSTYLSREELVRRIRYMEPNHTFREIYQYNNLMFVTAGFAAGFVSGSTWEDLVRDRLLRPIGMSRTNTSSLDSQRSDDFAKPYIRGREQEFYVYQKFGVGPNGAVNSCVDDMLKYLQMWLDNGYANGRQVISKAQMNELRRPVSVSSATTSYAPGWQVGFHRGTRMFAHGGSITGFRANVILLPEKKIGVVTLINSEENLADLLSWALADRALGAPFKDYLADARQASSQPTESTEARQPNTRPSRPLADYAGTYVNPAYGRVRVETDGDGFIVRFDALNLHLKHYNYDTFQSSQGLVKFEMNEKGQVSELHLPLEPAVKPFVFVKN